MSTVPTVSTVSTRIARCWWYFLVCPWTDFLTIRNLIILTFTAVKGKFLLIMWSCQINTLKFEVKKELHLEQTPNDKSSSGSKKIVFWTRFSLDSIWFPCLNYSRKYGKYVKGFLRPDAFFSFPFRRRHSILSSYQLAQLGQLSAKSSHNAFTHFTHRLLKAPQVL